MDYKTIFVPAVAEDSFKVALDAAVLLSKRFDGHIIASHVTQPFDLFMPAMQYPIELDSFSTAREQYEKSCDKLLHALRSEFDEKMDQAGINNLSLEEAVKYNRDTASWNIFHGAIAEIICHNARLADLIIMRNLDEEFDAHEIDLREQLLTETGRPLLLLPEQGLAQFPYSVVIGWNGSVEAARALTLALPILSRVNKITILTIGKIQPDLPDARAAAIYLEAHGIKAVVETVDKENYATGAQLMNVATEIAADLLIIGAYSHNRWREVLFGGVTRHLLSKADIPVLMVH